MSDFLTDLEGSLSEKAYGQENLQRKVDWAERMVIDWFRENRGRDSFRDEISELSPSTLPDVQLDGWREDENGEPDVDAMPDDLVVRFRECMIRILEHWAEDTGEIESETRGDRSWSYKEKAGKVPSTVYNPLQPRDETCSFGFGL